MAAAVDTQTDARGSTGPGRSFWILIGAIGALLVVGIVVALVASRQNGVTYPPHSPERAVQRYLNLLQIGQVDKAYNMTDLVDTRQEFHDQFDSWNGSSHRVTLVHTYVRGSVASVTVDITTFSGGVYTASQDTQRTTFTLDHSRAGWRIAGPEYLPY